MIEQEIKSPFFRAVTDVLDYARQLRTPDDSVLMVISDGITASHIVGGDHRLHDKSDYPRRSPATSQRRHSPMACQYSANR